MKHSQCNDYTALTVQWHKAIMQNLKIQCTCLPMKTKWNYKTSARNCSTVYVAAGGLCSVPVVSKTHYWQSTNIRSRSHSLLCQLPASVSNTAVWFMEGGCDSVCPSFGSVHTVTLPVVVNYKCKAKQQTAQFEGTMKTEVYFTNDWSRSKI